MAGRARPAPSRSTGGIPAGVPSATAPSAGLAQRAGAGRADLRAPGDAREPRRADRPGGGRPGTLALLARDARRSGAQERALAVALLLLLPACFGPIVGDPGRAVLPAAVRRLRAAAALGVTRALASHLAARAAAGPLGEPARRRADGRRGRGRLPDLRARSPAPRREPRRDGRGACWPLCANPALWHTPSYVLGVLHNEAAKQAIGLWAPLSVHSWLDVAFGLAAVVLLAGALRARPRAWELVALAGLALLTLHAARGGVWLALYAAPLAATGFGGHARSERIPRLARPVALALIAAVLLGLVHGPLPSGAGAPRSSRARSRSRTARRCWPRTCSLRAGRRRGRARVAGEPDRRLPGVRSARLRGVAARSAGRGCRAPARAARGARAPQQQGRAPAAHGCPLPPRGLRSARGARCLRLNFPRATCRWACHERPRAATPTQAFGATRAGAGAGRPPAAARTSAPMLALGLLALAPLRINGPTPGSASSRGATSSSTAFRTATG